MPTLRKALEYPRRYSAALAEARRVGSLPGDLDFDAAFDFVAARFGITQKRDEIRWLHGLVRDLRPSAVLEIGIDEGGTLFLWTRAATPEADLIAIDTRPLGPLGLRSPYALVRRRFAHGSQRVHLVMPADSHDPATAQRVHELLRGRKLDFLFVDGDHTRDGVWQDFHTYAPLVRPGGLIAFHDISPRTTPDTVGTAEFWREFKADHATEERVVGDAPGFGIGVHRVPE